jgi:hypothetical protein
MSQVVRSSSIFTEPLVIKLQSIKTQQDSMVSCRILPVVHLEYGSGFLVQVKIGHGTWLKVDAGQKPFLTEGAALERAEQFVAERNGVLGS